jgi:uncharacterized protein YggL (DUF469 family)
MKKRLRKKRRLGEFREECFELTFEVDSSLTQDQLDAVIDEFIEMIESRNLQYGGGGDYTWSGVVQGPYRKSATIDDRDTVSQWLRGHPQILAVDAGPLRDAWHGWS